MLASVFTAYNMCLYISGGSKCLQGGLPENEVEHPSEYSDKPAGSNLRLRTNG